MPKGASLNPKDALAGALAPDGEAVIESARAVMFDYSGKVAPAPAAWVHLKYVDGTEFDQYYSCGSADKLAPSPDGKRFINPNGDDGEAHFGKGSNFMLLVSSILDAGYPEDKLSDDLSSFDGMRVVIQNKPQPKRQGLQGDREGKVIPLVAKILQLPGEKPARPTTVHTGTSPASTPASLVATASELDTVTVEKVQEILAEAAGNTRTVQQLGMAILMRMGKEKDPRMADVKKLATDPTWLAAHAEEGAWRFDGKSVTLVLQ
jgi:hypothetical protein